MPDPSQPDPSRPDASHPDPSHPDTTAYWRSNLALVAICLTIWFAASYVFGILLVDQLNRLSVFGFKLGFWFAQQGSIFIFLGLVFYYAWRMNRLDRKYGVSEDESDQSGNPSGGENN